MMHLKRYSLPEGHVIFLICAPPPGVFADSLSPALDAFGLDGVFRLKEKQHEGLATFFRRFGIIWSQKNVVENFLIFLL